MSCIHLHEVGCDGKLCLVGEAVTGHRSVAGKGVRVVEVKDVKLFVKKDFVRSGGMKSSEAIRNNLERDGLPLALVLRHGRRWTVEEEANQLCAIVQRYIHQLHSLDRHYQKQRLYVFL